MSFRTVYDYTHSENGWRMCDRSECVVALPALKIPFTDTAPIRSGDAATILGAWVIWYHRHVEPLTSPVWGWSATNDVPDSNHLSGTAVDINAPKYPWGARTMPRDRIAKVREGLRLFEGTVFWGADWGRADEMHYQIGFPEGDPRIAAFAGKLNNGHLGIYSEGTGGDVMPALAETFTNYEGDPVGLGPFKGWTHDKIVVDSLADAHRKIDALTSAVQALVEAAGKKAA